MLIGNIFLKLMGEDTTIMKKAVLVDPEIYYGIFLS